LRSTWPGPIPASFGAPPPAAVAANCWQRLPLCEFSLAAIEYRRSGAMDESFDLFAFYRWALAIVCSVYTVIRLGQTAQSWLAFLWEPTPYHRTLRHYATVQLLRVRVRRFATELLEIVALTLVLAGLLWLHRQLGYVG
jgi:hypothetical protein